MKKLALLYGCLLIFILWGYSQLPACHVRLIRSSSLANPTEIEQIIKDQKGFLWLLSPTKLQRYDGRQFVSFLFDERVINIQQDAMGLLWLATRKAIYHYKNDYNGFVKLENLNKTTGAYRRLLTGPDKNIYVLDETGIKRWNKEKNSFVFFEIPPFSSEASFLFLKSLGPYLFFRPAKNTLARFNVNTKEIDSLRVLSPNYLSFINSDSVWVRQDIGNSALVCFKTKVVLPVTQNQFAQKSNSNNFFVTGSYATDNSSNRIVFLRGKGCFMYNIANNSFTEIHLYFNGLPLLNQSILSGHFQESNGTIWFANEEGLAHFNPGVASFGLLRSGSGASQWSNEIRNFAEDEQRNIWFATGDGFCKWDKNTGTVNVWKPRLGAEDYLNYPSIRSIAYGAGKIFVGQSEKGAWIFDPTNNNFHRPHFTNDSLAVQMEADFNSTCGLLNNGDYILFSRKTWILNGNSLQIKKLSFKNMPDNFRGVMEDSYNNKWLFGNSGVYIVDAAYKLLDSLTAPEFKFWCNSAVQLDTQTFLVASKYLYQINYSPTQKPIFKRLLPGLKDIHISHLFKDKNGHVWISADKGMFRFVPSKNIVEAYDQEDNIQSFYVSHSNHFRASDGTVYFGSLNGINYFVPEKIPLRNDSLNVSITNVTINHDDSTFRLGFPLKKLKHTQNSLVFDFVAPYVYNGNKVKYRYRLQGADKNWIETGHLNTVRFTSLQPGNYSFSVAATLNGKDWFETATPFHFTISPPFWNSWWFRTLMVVLLLAMVVLFIKQRIQKVKANAAIQQQVAELEVKALRSQMNPHFIFNVMNSIQQFTLQNDVDNANRYISKFSKLLRKVLHSSQQNYISLEEELEQLELYLDIEKVRLGEDFIYTIQVDEEADGDADAINIPSMLVQPFVENAIKHGLTLKEGIKNLDLHFQLLEEDVLRVVICDNGIGFSKAGELKLQSDRLLPYNSKGIKLVNERITLLQGSGKNLQLNIEDLKKSGGISAGTKVTLLIPIGTVEY